MKAIFLPEKLAEVRAEMTRILGTGKKFGISAGDIVQLIREIQED
jgi:hypothetical protein